MNPARTEASRIPWAGLAMCVAAPPLCNDASVAAGGLDRNDVSAIVRMNYRRASTRRARSGIGIVLAQTTSNADKM
jgi:hypothetical protein